MQNWYIFPKLTVSSYKSIFTEFKTLKFHIFDTEKYFIHFLYISSNKNQLENPLPASCCAYQLLL